MAISSNINKNIKNNKNNNIYTKEIWIGSKDEGIKYTLRRVSISVYTLRL